VRRGRLGAGTPNCGVVLHALSWARLLLMVSAGLLPWRPQEPCCSASPPVASDCALLQCLAPGGICRPLRPPAAAAAAAAAGAGAGRRCLTSMLWEEGVISSYFLPVKMSMHTKLHLAWPCLPVLEVDTSTTCGAAGHCQALRVASGRCVLLGGAVAGGEAGRAKGAAWRLLRGRCPAAAGRHAVRGAHGR